MMKVFGACMTVLATVLVSGALALGQQQESQPYTVITVQKMHCAGCAKRIGGKLQEVPGVAKIQYDVQKKLLWVHPQQGKQPSPRALWEAVEQAQDKPAVLQGPYGTFNKKPQR